MSDQTRTPEEWIASVRQHAGELAAELRDATDAGVPPALILPALIDVFRSAFGEMPAGFQLPFGMLGGGS